MTSKEALKELLMWSTNGYTALEVDSKEYKEIESTIKRDLEVLEIFKDMFKEKELELDEEYDEDLNYDTKFYYVCTECEDSYYDIKHDITEEQYNLLKEWLKNEN